MLDVSVRPVWMSVRPVADLRRECDFERAPEFFFSVNNCISGHVVFQALKWSAKHAWRLSQHFEAKFSGF